MGWFIGAARRAAELLIAFATMQEGAFSLCRSGFQLWTLAGPGVLGWLSATVISATSAKPCDMFMSITVVSEIAQLTE